MKFSVLTIFPEMFQGPFSESIMKRALKDGLFSLNLINIRDFSKDKHKRVDDRPFGGGPGMVMMCEPLYDAWKAVVPRRNKKTLTIYLSPGGSKFDYKKSRAIAENYNHVVFVCGHYEGVDQRFIDECVDEEISIGDFVLSGGELPAMVMMDSISRFIPGVLGNDNSKEEESFELHDDQGVLLEYPQYTRPRVFKKLEAPEILFSGNHKKIKEFRLKESRHKTSKIRPDLKK